LNELEKYIQKYNKKPSPEDKNLKKLGKWLSHQKTNYKKEKDIMKDPSIRKLWEEFLIKYKEYFQSNEDIWYNQLNDLETYIKTYTKIPSEVDKSLKIKQLGIWVFRQKKNYKKDQYIMKDLNIRKTWEEFMLKYKEYFQSNEENWYDNLNELEKYIKENKKIPNIRDKNLNIKQLVSWLLHQKTNYNKEKDIMKDPTVRKIWEEFTLKYKDYLKYKEEVWYDKLDKLKQYIQTYNKIPNTRDKDLDIKQLGSWVYKQKNNYNKEDQIMKDSNFRKTWEEFTTRYQEYL
jgi:hypothetical protein